MEKSTNDFYGIGITDDIAIGCAAVLKTNTPKGFPSQTENPDEDIARLQKAIAESYRQIEEIAKKAGGQRAEIVESQLELLQDPAFKEDAFACIRETKNSAEIVLCDITDRLFNHFSEMEDHYLRERAADIRDVGTRILNNLTGAVQVNLSALAKNTILFAHDLAPSETAQLDRNKVIGFVTEIGGKNGHTAIMARSLQIAATVGCKNILEEVNNGDVVIVDSAAGKVILRPNPDTLIQYEKRQMDYQTAQQAEDAARKYHLQRDDGRPLLVAANIGTLQDAERAKRSGADAIGLFRTEFLYMDRSEMPTEQEQFETYRQVTELFGNDPVVTRTLDIGGDKSLPYLTLPKEENPFLGVRAIRFCLTNPDLFKIQLRALLRASAFGNLQIMFPMISTFDELHRAKALLQECRNELTEKRVPFNENLRVGMMIEVPATAVLAEEFAKEVDFFSIGTNDLTQYTLAADRSNERLGALYDSMHPAVLALIHHTIESAHQCGIPCGMCGEMAADKSAIALLTEYGLDEFSVSIGTIGSTKKALLEQKGIRRL